MKHLISYKVYENLNNTQVSIEDFLKNIGMPQFKHEQIIEWWNNNRRNIKIHFFPFSSPKPIAGVFLGTDVIAVNQRLQMPPHVKLFLALHESRHCDQHSNGIFMSGYYDTVVSGDENSFLQSYRELEQDANSYAINGMREMGFEREMNIEEIRLRSNENAGPMVFRMMTDDIRLLNPTDFIDLLKKQIGLS